MREIQITVRDKIARKICDTVYVCGNSDYGIVFDFDDDWNGELVKTARFSYGGTHQDVVFEGNVCAVPVISNTHNIRVGVFAGNLQTTTAAYVPAKKSILCEDGTPADPMPDVYAQIMDLLNKGVAAEAIAEALTKAKESGEFDGVGIAKVEQTTKTMGALGENVVTVTLEDGRSYDFSVWNGARGEKGDPGKDGASISIRQVTTSDASIRVEFSDGTVVVIPKGQDGSAGVGIESAMLNDDYTLTLNFTNGTSYTTPSIRGEPGPAGSDANVTMENIKNALGYTPADAETVSQLSADMANKVTSPSVATVGQVIAAKAVDENGKPTEWEAVEMAAGGVQPDWNQNDESAPDFIKNRPFRDVDAVIMEEQTFDFLNMIGAATTLSAPSIGDIVTVYLNGTASSATVKDLSGGVYVGNLGILGAGDDTGEEFLVVFQSETSAIVYSNVETATVKITGKVPVKLPQKYYQMQTVFYVNGNDDYLYKDVNCSTKATKIDVYLAITKMNVIVSRFGLMWCPVLYANMDNEYAAVSIVEDTGTFSLKEYYTAEYVPPETTE